MMPLKRVWDIFTQMSHNAGGGDNAVANSTALVLESEKQLDALLARYKSNDVPIQVYKGLFDADIVLSPKIQNFVSISIANAFPWVLNIDSVDLMTILYSLGVLCYGVLYHATTEKLRNNLMTAILHTWGEKPPETDQAVVVAIKSSPERERFSVPHAARDPQVLQDRNLDNEDILNW